MNQESLNLVDIIISTRNRASELLKTLSLLLSYGILESNIYIVDDASTDNTFDLVKNKYPGVFITHNVAPLGYIYNRNYLMSFTDKPYVLSLDDDSCFINPNHVTEAVYILQSVPHYGIFNFNVFNQLQLPEIQAVDAKLREIKNFIGCGHIIKREVLNKVGFYREQLYFYCEEIDFSIKAFKAGYSTVTRDDLIIHHRVDFKVRQTQKKSKNDEGIYGHAWRNKMLSSNYLSILSIYLPLIFLPSIAVYYIPRLYYELVIKKKDWSGFWSGIKRYLKNSRYIAENRNPLTYNKFYYWIRLPMY